MTGAAEPGVAAAVLVAAPGERWPLGLAAFGDLPVMGADFGRADPVALGRHVRWRGQTFAPGARLLTIGFSYLDPVVPLPADRADYSLWQTGWLAEQQRHSFAQSLLVRLESEGLMLANPAGAHLLSFARHSQLAALAAAGLPTAPWITTNRTDLPAPWDGSAADQLIVWRPATGRALWQRFGPRQRQHLLQPDRPAVLLALAGPGVLHRAYVVDGRVVCLLRRHAADAHPARERAELFVPVAQASAEALVLAAARAAACPLWCAVDLTLCDDGPCLWDVDPDPPLDDMPAAVIDSVVSALGAWLGRTVPTPRALESESALERASLFLRRMLRIQFDMEATKH